VCLTILHSSNCIVVIFIELYILLFINPKHIFFLDFNKICPNTIDENTLKSLSNNASHIKKMNEAKSHVHINVAFFGRFVIF